MAKRKKVIVEDKHLVFNDFFKIEEARVRFERTDGKMSPPLRRLNFERGDSVAAIVYKRDTNRVVLVRQFRFPTQEKGPGWILETVAGIVDAGEDPEEAIRREVHEEIGYDVQKLDHVHTFYVSPGGSSERIILFLAEVTSGHQSGSGGGLDSESEDIEIVELAPDDLVRRLESREIVDAKTIIAAMWLQRHLGI